MGTRRSAVGSGPIEVPVGAAFDHPRAGEAYGVDAGQSSQQACRLNSQHASIVARPASCRGSVEISICAFNQSAIGRQAVNAIGLGAEVVESCQLAARGHLKDGTRQAGIPGTVGPVEIFRQ